MNSIGASCIFMPIRGQLISSCARTRELWNKKVCASAALMLNHLQRPCIKQQICQDSLVYRSDIAARV